MLALSGVYIGTVAVLVGYSEPVATATSPDPKITLGWLIGFVGLIFSTAMGLNDLLRGRRERCIALVTNGVEPRAALEELGERSAAVRVLDWITDAPFKLAELLARGAVWLSRKLLRLPPVQSPRTQVWLQIVEWKRGLI